MTAKVGDNVLALEPKKQTAFEKAIKNAKALKAKAEAEDGVSTLKYKPGIILLNHIPFGFFEKELRGYFSQFGHVLRIRLARSKKTGKSRGYAFIEFEFEDVAKIAAECMDGYLMFERLLKCEVLPQGIDSKKIFNQRYIREDNYPKLRARKRVKAEQNKTQPEEDVKEFLQFRLRKLEEQNQKLAEMGIEYKFLPVGITFPTASGGPASTRVQKEKTPDIKKSAFSPKLLRSRKSDASGFHVSISAPIHKEKTPDKKSKFSPKLLRSRKSDVSGLSGIHSSTPIHKEKSPDKKPKFSPKLLRSRKSDVSGLSKSPFMEKKSPKNKKLAGRKSVR